MCFASEFCLLSTADCLLPNFYDNSHLVVECDGAAVRP